MKVTDAPLDKLIDILAPDRPGRDTGLSRILQSRRDELTIALTRELGQNPALERKVCDLLLTFFTPHQTDGPTASAHDPGSHLRTELDQYIAFTLTPPREIVSLSGPQLQTRLSLARAVRQAGRAIIDYHAHIHNIQTALWQKIKFVTDTQYCLTLDLVPSALYPQVWANSAQRAEWEELYGVIPPTADSLNTQPHLMLDTRHFSPEFKAALLSTIDSLDERCDGLLIHGDNAHALNLIHSRYRGRINCLYTDPPFNTNDTGFTYRNEYPQSEWCAMMHNTLDLVRPLLTPTGVAAVAIDDRELHHLGLICDDVFGFSGRLGILTVEIKPSGRTNDRFLATSHEYYLFYGIDPAQTKIAFFDLTEEQTSLYVYEDDIGPYRWRDFLRTGGYSTPQERPNSCYPIWHCPQTGEIGLEHRDGWDQIWPMDSAGRMRVWRKTPPSLLRHLQAGEIRIGKTRANKPKVQIIDRIKIGTRPKSVWTGKRYDAASHGTRLLESMFGQPGVFSFPKSIHAAEDVIHIATANERHPLILDCFAGSGTAGHAVINLNRQDAGGRRYILIELGEHFDTVLLPRLKKAVCSGRWKAGRPAGGPGTSHMCKYIRLESYGDAVSAVVPVGECGPEKRGVVRYILDEQKLSLEGVVDAMGSRLGTGDSAGSSPALDLVETFNWLLGLTVRRQVRLEDSTVIKGESPDGRRLLIVWRDPSVGGVRPDAWEEFLLEQFRGEDIDGFNLIYTNGSVVVQDNDLRRVIRPIEPEFSRLMFAGR